MQLSKYRISLYFKFNLVSVALTRALSLVVYLGTPGYYVH